MPEDNSPETNKIQYITELLGGTDSLTLEDIDKTIANPTTRDLSGHYTTASMINDLIRKFHEYNPNSHN